MSRSRTPRIPSRSVGPVRVAILAGRRAGLAALVASGCGGSGGDSAPPPPEARGLDAPAPAFASSESADGPIRDSALVAYLANEGVLIVAAGRTVVLDALFREGVVHYARPGVSIREPLEEATGAFSGLDLVLATHHHADHFDAEAVLRHLRSNPEGRFISTLQAVSRLEAAEAAAGGGAGAESVMSRVTGAWPAEGDRETVAFGRIEVELLNLHHGRRGEEVQNLGFLLDIDGFRVLHVGDTQATVEELAAYDLGGEAVDIAFIPYWKLLEAEGPALVREIGARQLVAVHVPAADAPASYWGDTGGRAGLIRELGMAYPGVLVFTQPGESHRFGFRRPPR